MISVIVPVFEGERFIGRCLRSLLHQTLSRDKYQIIVINDGSTDRTRYALDLFKEDIKIINNKKNLGLPKSLNKGIISSNSNFIVRVDSDDYVNTHFLEILSEYLIQNEEADEYMDAVACDYKLVDDAEKNFSRKNCLKDPIGCGIMFRTKHYKEIGLYDENFLRHEDKDLRKRFEKKFKIHRIKMPLYRYRRHEHNITNDEKVMDYHLKKLKKKHKMK